MEKKNVNVSIKGIQVQDGDSSDVELFTEGTLEKRGSKYVLVYNESEVTGLGGTTTMLEIDGEKVSLVRNGTVNNQMIFIKDKKTTSYYETQYGSLIIGVLTDRINVDMGDSGGTVSINYTIDINEEYTGENSFFIDIKEA